MNVDTHKENDTHIEAQSFSGTPTDGPEPLDLEGRVKELEAELQEAKDRYLRNLADVENMRKRQERERADLLKYASEKLLQDILPVLDSFEKAIQVQQEASNPVIEGVRMVHKQFVHILEQHGLRGVESQGKAFDPNLHQAIQRVESDEVPSEIVKDEYQKGYTLNGRLLRPSMVSVFVPKSSGPAEE